MVLSRCRAATGQAEVRSRRDRESDGKVQREPGVGDGDGAATPSVRSPEVGAPFERAVLDFGVEVVFPVPATPSDGVVGFPAVPRLFSFEPGPGTGDGGLPATPSVGVVGPAGLLEVRTGFFFLGAFFFVGVSVWAESFWTVL